MTVNGGRGFWISGPQHFFYYVDPSGAIVEDSRRSVGDTLIWTDGDVTYRLESRLGMEEAIRLAESLRWRAARASRATAAAAVRSCRAAR